MYNTLMIIWQLSNLLLGLGCVIARSNGVLSQTVLDVSVISISLSLTAMLSVSLYTLVRRLLNVSTKGESSLKAINNGTIR